MEDQNLGKNEYEKKLYYEYVDTYKKILKYKSKVSNKIYTLRSYCRDYKNVKEYKIIIENIKLYLEKKKIEKKHLINIESDLLYTMMCLERYLSYSDRFYSNSHAEEQRRKTFNKTSTTGIVFKEDLNKVDVESLVHNKILQNELLTMLKDLLSNKQYSCMYMYFYNNFTQEQIAESLDMTQQNVSLHIENSIKIIRNSDNFKNFLKFL